MKAENSFRADQIGTIGSNGHSPDTGFANLAGTSDSSVTVIAGHAFLSTGVQNPVIEDDPIRLQAKNNGKVCGIEVTFRPGTTYPGTTFPNGPGTFTRPDNGEQIYGLGFTVKGWVESGGIGKIGGDSKPDSERINKQNPKGTWTLDQQSNRWTNVDGYKPTWSDISPDLLALEATGDTFSYYDHPGTSGGNPHGVIRYQNFIVKVYKGKIVCEVAFHFVQRGAVIHWGEGTR